MRIRGRQKNCFVPKPKLDLRASDSCDLLLHIPYGYSQCGTQCEVDENNFIMCICRAVGTLRALLAVHYVADKASRRWQVILTDSTNQAVPTKPIMTIEHQSDGAIYKFV